MTICVDIRKTYSDSMSHIILYFHVEAGMICGLEHIHIILYFGSHAALAMSCVIMQQVYVCSIIVLHKSHTAS